MGRRLEIRGDATMGKRRSDHSGKQIDKRVGRPGISQINLGLSKYENMTKGDANEQEKGTPTG